MMGMKTANWLVIALAAGVAVGGVMVVRAQSTGAGQSGPGLGRGGLLAQFAGRLDLTADQKAKIKAVMASERETLTGLLTTLHQARAGLRTTIQTADASENEVRGAAAKVASVEADLAVERAKIYGRIRPMLTAAQLDRIGGAQQRVDELVDGVIVAFNQRLAE
jgi:Spy/CpxP family protein refolding chaperone